MSDSISDNFKISNHLFDITTHFPKNARDINTIDDNYEYITPRVEIQRSTYSCDTEQIQNELQSILEDFNKSLKEISKKSKKKHLETIYAVLNSLNQYKIDSSNIDYIKNHCKGIYKTFIQLLFSITNELSRLDKKQDGIKILAEFATYTDSKGKLFAYGDFSDVESVNHFASSFAKEDWNWSKQIFHNLRKSLDNENENYFAKRIDTTNYGEEVFKYRMFIEKTDDPDKITLISNAQEYDRVQVDVSCEEKNQDSFIISEIENNEISRYFKSQAFPLCKQGQTTINWEASGEKTHKKGIGKLEVQYKYHLTPKNNITLEGTNAIVTSIKNDTTVNKYKKYQVIFLIDTSRSMKSQLKNIHSYTSDILSAIQEKTTDDGSIEIGIWGVGEYYNGNHYFFDYCKEFKKLAPSKSIEDQEIEIKNVLDEMISDLSQGYEFIWDTLINIIYETKFDYDPDTKRKIIVLTDELGDLYRFNSYDAVAGAKAKNIDVDIHGPAKLIQYMGELRYNDTISFAEYADSVIERDRFLVCLAQDQHRRNRDMTNGLEVFETNKIINKVGRNNVPKDVLSILDKEMKICNDDLPGFLFRKFVNHLPILGTQFGMHFAALGAAIYDKKLSGSGGGGVDAFVRRRYYSDSFLFGIESNLDAIANTDYSSALLINRSGPQFGIAFGDSHKTILNLSPQYSLLHDIKTEHTKHGYGIEASIDGLPAMLGFTTSAMHFPNNNELLMLIGVHFTFIPEDLFSLSDISIGGSSRHSPD